MNYPRHVHFEHSSTVHQWHSFRVNKHILHMST